MRKFLLAAALIALAVPASADPLMDGGRAYEQGDYPRALAAWQPPPEAKRIIIFGDNDPNYTGQAAAYALAKRLRSDERVVEVQIPAEVGADWNDVHELRFTRVEVLHATAINRFGQIGASNG